MIFYFTGTGNSLYAARTLALEGERLIDMAKARNSGEFHYAREKRERVGFVFPEYFSAVPELVQEFISGLDLAGRGYTFAVITCGGASSFCAGMLRHLLAERGIPLYYVTHIRMPDNAILFWNTPSAEKKERLLRQAEEKLTLTRKLLLAQVVRKVKGGLVPEVMMPLYRLMQTTKPFAASENCTGCGQCARNCPDRAIEMQNGRPVWVKGHCTLCTACINRCPAGALQFGKNTEKRRRYVNPKLSQF